MGETGGAHSECVGAAIALGNAAMQWRQLAEQMERERNQAFADLAGATARADGYALLVGEYRAVLQAWSDADPLTGDLLREHFRAVLARREAILAADPEARAVELLADGEDA